MSAPLALIMAGGTGGHVFPALALARELRARHWRVVWLGTRRGLEAKLVPADGIPMEWLSVGGLRGKGVRVWLGAPLRLLRALLQSMAVIRRNRPALVVGLGGFAAGPGGIAAWLLRRPLLIHEQNAVAGFTNRCLSHCARRVLAAFPGAFPHRCPCSWWSEIPVRREILALPPPAQRFALRDRRDSPVGARRQSGRSAPQCHRPVCPGQRHWRRAFRGFATRRASVGCPVRCRVTRRRASARGCMHSSMTCPRLTVGRIW